MNVPRYLPPERPLLRAAGDAVFAVQLIQSLRHEINLTRCRSSNQSLARDNRRALTNQHSIAMKTFDITECADFLKVDRSTILKLAAEGEIPGAKIGRAWVFLEDDIVAFLRKQVVKQADARMMGLREETLDAQLQRAVDRQKVDIDPRRAGRRKRPLPTLPNLSQGDRA